MLRKLRSPYAWNTAELIKPYKPCTIRSSATSIQTILSAFYLDTLPDFHIHIHQNVHRLQVRGLVRPEP